MPAFQGFDCDAPATVVFGHGQSAASVDTVVYATGYVYSFPFLDGAGIVGVDRNRVHPLYRHVWPPAHAPGIAFVGIPWKVRAPPPAGEMQTLGKGCVTLEAEPQSLGRFTGDGGRPQASECRLGGDYGEAVVGNVMMVSSSCCAGECIRGSQFLDYQQGRQEDERPAAVSELAVGWLPWLRLRTSNVPTPRYL